jgi:hypothetical protein
MVCRVEQMVHFFLLSQLHLGGSFMHTRILSRDECALTNLLFFLALSACSVPALSVIIAPTFFLLISFIQSSRHFVLIHAIRENEIEYSETYGFPTRTLSLCLGKGFEAILISSLSRGL